MLAQVGGWRQVLLDDDVETRRRVLALIIQTIIPERVRPGEYRVQIAWTPSGELLRQLVDQGDSAAA